MYSFKGFYNEITDTQGRTYRLGENDVVAIQLRYENDMWGHTFAIYKDEKAVETPLDEVLYVHVASDI